MTPRLYGYTPMSVKSKDDSEDAGGRISVTIKY